MIKSIKLDDRIQISDIHFSALPDDFLPSLGRQFILDSFYPACIDSSNALFLGYVEQDSLCAFAMFASDSKKLTWESLLRQPGFYWALIKKILKHPMFVKELYTIFRAKRIMLDKHFKLDQYPELYLIAVDPTHQSKGIGRQILIEGLNYLKRQSDNGCIVKTSSEQAKNFYENNGFRVVGEEYRGLRKLYILFHDLSNISIKNKVSSTADLVSL